MIPSDLAARLRLLTEASFFDSEPPIQGPARVREIQARLPELAPGERFTATLQRALPDGTFQAIVAGRTYTLALNHPAKSGDTLELVATRNSANTVFAQLAPPQQQAAATAGEAARPALSPVGRLIGFLLTGQPTPRPAELAAGKPLLPSPPTTGGTPLAPVLQQAIASSGLFYEAHQKQWLSGKLDTQTLLREPQGQMPPPSRPGTTATMAGPPTTAPTPTPMPGLQAASAPSALLQNELQPFPSGQPSATSSPAAAGSPQPMPGFPAGSAPSNLLQNVLQTLLAGQPSAADEPAAAGTPQPMPAQEEVAQVGTPANPLRAVPESGKGPIPSAGFAASPGGEADALERANSAAAQTPVRAAGIPERLVPVVHQQLDALATQNYAWHGQVWPGQTMEWEIEDPEGGERDAGDDTPAEWKTTLRLTLPRLGGLEANLVLTPAGVALRLLANDDNTVEALLAAKESLDSALEAANLPLTGFVAERRDVG